MVGFKTWWDSASECFLSILELTKSYKKWKQRFVQYSQVLEGKQKENIICL